MPCLINASEDFYGTGWGEPNTNVDHLHSVEGVCSQPVNSCEPVIPEGGKRLSIVTLLPIAFVPKPDELCVLIETYKSYIFCMHCRNMAV